MSAARIDPSPRVGGPRRDERAAGAREPRGREAPEAGGGGAVPSPPRRDGLLLLDKPEGPTSHDVVFAARRLLGGARTGHAGTLDPFASGLLVVAVGRATRLLRFLARADKTYEGTIAFGVATDTDDRTGSPLGEARPASFSENDLAAALEALSGEFEQIPPAFSARKHEGVPHYRLARKGLGAPRRPATARARWLEVERPEAGTIRFRMTVSAGTYVRAIARDLGEALGCGAHLDSLRRVASGPFRIEEAVPYPAPAELLFGALRPLEEIPLDLPTLSLDPEACRTIGHGGAVPLPAEPELPAAPSWVRLLDPAGRLIGVAEVSSGSAEATPLLRPRVVL